MMKKDFHICFTSDTHGYLFPTDYTGGEEKPMGLFKLGAAFHKDGNTLILDGGDTIQGSPFTNFTHRMEADCHPIARAMNMIGYDYVTLGNHDFNYGLSHLHQYLSELDAVCLCANIRDKAGKLPILPYAIHTLENGLRIGITGICTHYITIWEKKETLDQLIVEEPIPAAKRALDAMKGQIDISVCLYHGGFECDLKTGKRLTDSQENQAWQLCQEGGFDIVLTGHQHMPVDQLRIGGTLALQPAYRAVHYGRMDGAWENGVITASSRLCPPADHPLAEPAAALAAFEAAVQQWLDTPKGHLDRPLPAEDHLKMASQGCLLANFINTVQLDASGAMLSATSMGNEIKGMNRDVTIRDVVSSYIYSNTLVLLEMTGEQLKRYTERTASYFTLKDGMLSVSDDFLKPKVEHYNYDYFLGMDYTIDVRRPVGDRVTSMKIDGKEIAPEDKITICVNNYRASGTGGYEMVREARVIREIQTDVSELIIAYIENHPDIQVNPHRSLHLITA